MHRPLSTNVGVCQWNVHAEDSRKSISLLLGFIQLQCNNVSRKLCFYITELFFSKWKCDCIAELSLEEMVLINFCAAFLTHKGCWVGGWVFTVTSQLKLWLGVGKKHRSKTCQHKNTMAKTLNSLVWMNVCTEITFIVMLCSSLIFLSGEKSWSWKTDILSSFLVVLVLVICQYIISPWLIH